MGRGAGLSGGRQRSATFSGFWECHCVEGLRTWFSASFFRRQSLFWFGTKGFSLSYGARAKGFPGQNLLNLNQYIQFVSLNLNQYFQLFGREIVSENVFHILNVWYEVK
jgi:hypothetical protein